MAHPDLHGLQQTVQGAAWARWTVSSRAARVAAGVRGRARQDRARARAPPGHAHARTHPRALSQALVRWSGGVSSAGRAGQRRQDGGVPAAPGSAADDCCEQADAAAGSQQPEPRAGGPRRPLDQEDQEGHAGWLRRLRELALSGGGGDTVLVLFRALRAQRSWGGLGVCAWRRWRRRAQGAGGAHGAAAHLLRGAWLHQAQPALIIKMRVKISYRCLLVGAAVRAELPSGQAVPVYPNYNLPLTHGGGVKPSLSCCEPCPMPRAQCPEPCPRPQCAIIRKEPSSRSGNTQR